jgi:pimeloyl-ACP methyl ester carboxylesterase
MRATYRKQQVGKLQNARKDRLALRLEMHDFMASLKSTYVLVHGAWYGSWCWKRVRTALQESDQNVFTPTLTGLAERSHLAAPNINLSTHIADIVNLIKWEELSDVVLCGHSYGGCVISGVAEQIPDRIRALIYLDAFVLEDGECLFDLFSDGVVDSMRELAEAYGDGWKLPPIPSQVFNLNSLDRDWADSQVTPHPIAGFEERIRLTGRGTRSQDITHVLATGFEGSAIPPSHQRAHEKGWATRSIESGHMVMLDRPDELADLLLEYS